MKILVFLFVLLNAFGFPKLPRILNDSDGDGFIDARDCDDFDPTIAIGTVWGPDIDGDGDGDLDLRMACICLPQGTVPTGDYAYYKPGCD